MLYLYFMLSLIISQILAKSSDLYDKFYQSDFKLKFEHLDVDYYNKSLIKEMKIVTFKYNRTTPACNGTFEVKIDMGNDVDVIIQAFKFASNEYRIFPLRLQVNICTAMSRNLIGTGDFIKCGNFSGCPIKKGKLLQFCNCTTDESRYPPFLPNGRYMLELQFVHKSAELLLLKSYAEVYRPILIPD